MVPPTLAVQATTYSVLATFLSKLDPGLGEVSCPCSHIGILLKCFVTELVNHVRSLLEHPHAKVEAGPAYMEVCHKRCAWFLPKTIKVGAGHIQ